MTKFFQKTFAILLITFFCCNRVEARFSLLAGVNQFQIKRSVSLGLLGDLTLSETTPVSASGGGIAWDTPVQGKWFFEVDVIYMGRGFKQGTAEYSFNTLQVPLMARYWENKFIGAFLGLHTANGLGKVTAKSVTGTTTELTFEDLNLTQMDYGLVYGLSVAINHLLLELRLTSGIQDVDTTTIKGTTTETQFFVGYNF